MRAFSRRRIWLAAGLALCVAGLIFVFSRSVPSASPTESIAAQPAVTAPSAVQPAAVDWNLRVSRAAPADFPDLARQILSAPASVERDKALAVLLSAWIKSRPEGLRAFLDSFDVDDALGGEFFSALARALPYVSDDAAASPYLSEAVSRLVDARAAEDPAAALAWAEQWLLDDALEKARVTVAGAFAPENPEEALKLLAKITNPLRRVQALEVVAEGYAANDPQAATVWAEGLPIDAEVAAAMNSVLCVIAENDPQAASRAFQSLHGRIAEKYARLVAENRRQRGLPENPPLDAQGNPIVEDAGGEEAMPAESPDLDLLADASGTIARGLAEGDPAAALQWTASLPPLLQTEAKRAALTTWAESDPEAAYRYCVTQGLTDGDTFAGVFESWAEADPQVAATTATTVSNARLRGRAIEGAVGTWAAQAEDPAQIAAWISRLPREEDRNVANRALAASIDADQPKLAWDHALQISNPRERRAVLSSAFASLAASQPRLAATALSQAGSLTPDERRLLSHMLDASAR